MGKYFWCFLFSLCFLDSFTQQSEYQYDHVQRNFHGRTERFENGYYTFVLSGNDHDEYFSFYEEFSNEHQSNGLLGSEMDYIDVIRVNDSTGYAMFGGYGCYQDYPPYVVLGIELFQGQFTSQLVWENEDVVSSTSRPFFLPMNDSLLLIISGAQCLLFDTQTWEHTSHNFEGASILDAIALNENEILLVGENDIFLFNIFSGNIQTVYQSFDWAYEMEKTNENYLRLCYNKFELFDSQFELINTYSFPTTEWAVPKLDRVGDTFYVITEDQTDKSNRLYVFDQTMNLLNQLLFEDGEDIAIDHFLWLEDRIFTAGMDTYDPLNLGVRSLNYRFYNHDGLLLELRTEDIALNSMEFLNLSHTIENSFFLGPVVAIRSDLKITVTNHSQVPVETYNLVSRPLLDLGPGDSSCNTTLSYSDRYNFPFLEPIAPGQTDTLYYNDFLLSYQNLVVLNTSTEVGLCVAVYNPNHYIDKDRSNDHYCASYSYFVNGISEQRAPVFQIQKQNGSWIFTNVRGAQIELFDLTGRLLLRTSSTEDQFFLPEVKENAAFTVVRITKGEELLVQKLSDF